MFFFALAGTGGVCRVGHTCIGCKLHLSAAAWNAVRHIADANVVAAMTNIISVTKAHVQLPKK